MNDIHRLYAITHSLYSGRARAYLIKQGIAFRELSTGHESFKAEVLPKAGIPTIPTLVTPDGEVIRDGAAIIEHFEASSGRPSQPLGPRQRIMSALFDVIGTDGLLRPAMHYRWNFEDNLDFIHYHFLHSQRDLPQRQEKTEHMMGRMRFAAQMFGVNDETTPLVEELYLDYLAALDKHFGQYPYLLGWRPCIGDFGLLAPMYAHLGRDPYPAQLMQQRAVRVYRWVERMNRADQDVPEFFDPGSDFLADDEVPETLIAVLRILAEDFIPETRAAAEAINRWLEEKQPEQGAPAVLRLSEGMGNAEFAVRGQSMTAIAQPYRFYLLQRVQEEYAALAADEQASVKQLLEACGMSAVLAITLQRSLGRANNLEVWL
ncbi:glutathione S-transferase family protein [Halieaceae bacterium IMCC14734]|uniref:Glutathione S-transferase family protein n=1 Tax=Candidatus Litorirhabdus singularis TaxID=2518993 RepID=A0ABT3TF89_9GAMM|nr:glutathione S-transferase family protein [Candidatus Litorirhabdus singularis]MCX2980919.1 glutathione S-transferase family protein [Candidatus Litorirhabdus singularis]